MVKNKLTELNPDYMIQSITPLYNKNKHAYDAAIVNGYKLTNGVFYVGSNVTGDTAQLVTDADLRVAYDVSHLPSSLQGAYKLNDNRYYFESSDGDIITDKSLNVICAANGAVYDSVERVKFTGADGKYGLADYDGKVVVPAKYNHIDGFYGGKAFCTKTVDGETKKVLIDANGNETELPDEAVQGAYGIYTVTKEVEESYTMTIYNYQGTLLHTFAELEYASSVQISYPFVEKGNDLYILK